MARNSQSEKMLTRPKKPLDELRNQRAECWLSAAEFDHIQALADQVSAIDYCRQVVLNKDALAEAKAASKLSRSPDSKRLRITLTFAESNQLKTLAAGHKLSVADYMRQALLAFTKFDADKNILQLELDDQLAKRLTALASQHNITLAEYFLHQAQSEPSAGPSRATYLYPFPEIV